MLSQFENRLNTGQAVVVTVLIPNVGDKLGGGGSGNREALFDAGEVKGAEKAAAHKESTLAAHKLSSGSPRKRGCVGLPSSSWAFRSLEADLQDAAFVSHEPSGLRTGEADCPIAAHLFGQVDPSLSFIGSPCRRS